MSDEGDVTHEFVCPECQEALEVDASMREVLLEKGCVICGAALSPEAFTPERRSDSG